MASSSADLDRFVRDALLAGQSRESIRAVLLQAGWTPEQLATVLEDYAEVEFPIPVPKPRASLSARDAFLYLVLFSLLFFLCFHLGSLLFDLIKAALPDPAEKRSYYDFFSSTRFSTAALIISFPLFAWVAHFLGRETERSPIKRLSPVRRWLTYLTLFVSVAILVGDMTTLVYNVLAGELTKRFLAKVLVVAVIAGSVFFYYLGDLRRDEHQLQAQHAWGRRLLIGAGVLAVAAIVGGFLLMGSPGHQRDARIDQRRVSDLEEILSAVRSHAEEHKALPARLDPISGAPGVVLSVTDPVSKQPYEYRVLGVDQIEMCAVFATSTSTRAGAVRRTYVEKDWPHEAGRTCFKRRIEMKAAEDAAAVIPD